MSDPQNRFFSRFFLVVACAIIALAPAAFAQVTTGSIAGTVTAAGEALPGVTVEAVHTPTGTRYDTISSGNGRFTIPNVRVGGPYRVTATLEGFSPFEATNVQVALGQIAEVPVNLALATVSEAITVTAAVDPIINPNRTGSTTQLSEEQIQTLPTVNRSLQDFARTNPYFRTDPSSTLGELTVAGRNNRYNSIQIDGAVNNDLFGLSASGAPGGQSDAQPISLEAIEQIQLVVSPYDVRQGGFTGGGINAVTRSGTNDWHGSVFGSQRAENFVGKGPFIDENVGSPTFGEQNRPVTTFDQDQYGGRIGGPIMRDRLFFFLSGERNERSEPTGTSAAGDAPEQASASLRTALERVSSILNNTYNFDPGPLTEIQRQTGNDSYFGRLDWNIGSSNQLTLRHNYNDGGRDNVGTRSQTRFTFPNTNYRQANETNSTVAQLNSVFSATAYNEARIGYQTIKDQRAVPVRFPAIEIGGANQLALIAAGTERFSAANALDQSILEITDDFTWVRGAHNLTIGTHNEIFEFKNLFMSDAIGSYFFGSRPGETTGNPLDVSMANFEANRPTEYRITYATGDDPTRPTVFEAATLGLYVNDQWRVSNNLTLTGGLRVDMPRFPESPSRNVIVEQAIGMRTDAIPKEDPVLSPRLGFNWNPGAGGNQQLRGGIGVFAGRTPFVWVSNAYAGTGIEQVSLTCLASAGCAVPAFNPDPNNQPRIGGTAAAGTLTVDLIDPDFEFPRVLRTTLGYDRDLFFGVRGTAEIVHTMTQADVYYYNANRRQTGTNAIDGRPTYAKVNTSQLDSAYVLSNTDEGKETTATLQLTRPFTNGITVGANYAWQDAQSVFDATSSRAISNWQNRHTPGDIFEDDLSTSAFEVEQRLNAYATYDFRTGPVAHNIGFFYNMQAGRPFSLIQGNDANTDLRTGNDLLYIPAQGQVIYEFANAAYRRGVHPLTGRTAEEEFRNLMTSIGADPYAGRITDRYEFQEPWNRRLDIHYEFGIPLFGTTTSLQFDVLNALNLIDKDFGTVQFLAFQNSTVASFVGTDQATGKPIFREAANDRWQKERFFSVADLPSRWQARFGLRVAF
jgi:outer membrane receptor for ferrienterochelin and colicin